VGIDKEGNVSGNGVTMTGLRTWNAAVGGLHFLQGLIILAIANDFAIPVVAPVQTGPPGSPLTEEVTFFDIQYAAAIAIFLLLAAIDHLLMAAPGVTRWYEANLRRGINPARWIEYSLSASVMIVLIAMLTGITNFYALLALFGVNSAMILFGFLMERVNTDREQLTWWPFVFGCIAGAVPWISITIAIVVASRESDGVPGFVYGIFVSLFLLFNCFALNQWLQYRGKGRFADYLYGERVYVVLSLVAKSALAWQVYAGTLAD
jgi:hypothetical protein